MLWLALNHLLIWARCWMSTGEVFICYLNRRWEVHFLTQLAWPCLLNYAKLTSCEFKLDQNPVESARKVKTRPESLIRIPKHISITHFTVFICLLYEALPPMVFHLSNWFLAWCWSAPHFLLASGLCRHLNRGQPKMLSCFNNPFAFSLCFLFTWKSKGTDIYTYICFRGQKNYLDSSLQLRVHSLTELY